MDKVRQIEGLPQPQGEDEEVTYTLDVTEVGSNPSNVSVVVKRNGVDVSGDVLDGTATVSGNIITLPVIASLEAGFDYRVEVKFTLNGNVLEAYGIIVGEE